MNLDEFGQILLKSGHENRIRHKFRIPEIPPGLHSGRCQIFRRLIGGLVTLLISEKHQPFFLASSIRIRNPGGILHE